MNYFRRYVLTDRDIGETSSKSKQETKRGMQESDIDFLIKGFGPESNSWDRRFLYEVTGLRLNDSEFRGESTSSSEEEEADGDGDSKLLS